MHRKFKLPNFLLPLPTISRPFVSHTREGFFYVFKTTRRSLLRKLTVFLMCVGVFLFADSTWAQTPTIEGVFPASNETAFVTVKGDVVPENIPIFTLPVQELYISTYFSRWHQGVDLPNPGGAPVHPVASGIVVSAGWSTLGYGNLVIVRHDENFISLYAHLNTIYVRVGQQVTSTSVLGGVGRTGDATGNHLHLEMHFQNVPVNPMDYLPLK